MATYKRATADEIYNYVTGQSSSMSSQYPTAQPKANNQKLMKLSDYEEQQRKKEEEEKKRLKAQSDARQKAREERSRAEKAAEQLNVQKKKEIMADAQKAVNPRTSGQTKLLAEPPKKQEEKKTSAPAIPQSRQPVKKTPYNQQPSYKTADSALKLQQLEYDKINEQVKQENPNAPEKTVTRITQNKFNALQNERIAKADEIYNREFAKEHPVLGTIGSFGSNLVSGAGVALEYADALKDGRDIDPNSPYFKYTRQTQDLRSGALENIEENADTKIGKTLGKGVYQLGTTLGDMALSRAITGPLGSVGYSANMALQAASSTAQDAASRGLSNEQIMTEAIVSGALTAAAENLGFDDVFKPSNATTVRQLIGNVVKGFAAEGAEEATEEIGNSITDLLVGGEKSALYTSAYSYMEQGYSKADAFNMAVKDAAKQIGSSFVIGGLSGGLMAGANSAPSYFSSATNRINNSLFPNQINDVPQPSVNNENIAKTQANPNVESVNETVDTQNKNAVTEQISAPDSELDNFDINDTETEAQTTVEENAESTVIEGEDGTYFFEDEDDFDVEPLKTLNDNQAQETARTIEENRAVMESSETTAEEKNTAQSEIIKAEYEAEVYDGITGDKTEAYTSGNPAVDALVNTNGRLNKTVTVNTQKEQKLVDFAAEKFNRIVRFVDTLDGSNGFYDRNTGEIVIARDSQKSMLTVFGHEFMHSLEGTAEYRFLATHLRYNSPYVKAKIAEAGGWEALRQNKITEYQNALGQNLDKPGAEHEIFADAISDELFSDYKVMEQLATQNRSVFVKLKQWFTENFVNTREQTRVYGTKVAERRTYALMLQAEKAAMSGVQNDEGVAFSAKKKYNKKTTYHEYYSIVQQWSHSADRNPGDIEIFNNEGKEFRLLKATENGGYIEMVRGIFKKVEAAYVETRREIDEYRETVYESADRYEADGRPDSWNTLDDKIKKTNGQNSQQIAGEGFPNYTSGDYEYNRQSNIGRRLNDNIDADYMSAVESGDIETAQRLVKEAAEKAGYNYTAYHGTKDAFTVFESGHSNKYDSGYLGEGFYFTDQKNFAEDYSNWKKGNGEKKVMNVALKIDNPLVVEDSRKPHLIAVQEALGLHLTDFGNYLFTPNNEISKAITDEAKKQGYDGIIRHSDAYGETTFVVFNSNQVKSMDAVTYDDNGDVISLSQRFNSSNPDIRYSAKKSEIVQRIEADYGYTEASANNIYKAARTLKETAGSTSDVEELTNMVVTTLESRRKGEIDSKDIERITMLLADDAKAVNEDFVAENRPILDYIKGMTLSISEEDISDLGDAFSYVKGQLFPYVTLTKGEGNVDSAFQDLASRFPNAFNAEVVTNPADQIKAIMGFIEDYRENRYFKPYFADNEAYIDLREKVSALVKDNLIDNATYLKKLNKMVNTYGELKNGVPQSTDGQTRVRATAASIYGSDAVKNKPELVARYTRDIVNGKYDYQVMRQGKEAANYLDMIKSSDNIAETVANEYKALKSKIENKSYEPADILHAAALNPLLAEFLNDDDYVDYTMLVAEVGTTSGQIISSLRAISQFSGPQRLKAINRKVEQINKKQSRHYKGDIESGAVADGNGQFVNTDKPAGKKGVIEFVVTRNQSKYPPIEIPVELEQKLAKARTQEEIETATDEINKYLAEQIHYSWFDKLNAWRYFAMLSNPKTAIRNTIGNVAMSATSRIKDAYAAGLSKTNLAKGYKDGSVQTTAVKTTKEARNAATTLLVEDDSVMNLFSGQDKYTGRINIVENSDSKLNKVEQKLADSSPILGLILNNRSIQPTAMAQTKVPIVGKALGKASDIQQMMLDDTPYKVLRAKNVLAQAITANIKNGTIENLDDFMAVALHQNTDHLDNATKIKYAQLYDTFCQQAAKEGDEATFRDDNSLANKMNKLRQGDKISERIGTALIDGLVPFVKTPANIVKRGIEYSPVGAVKTLIADRAKLAQGDIDRNTYINNLSKGLTGTSIFALGALLSAFEVLSVGDDDEEDEAERTLLGGQEYALDFGDASYSIEFLTPSALPLFMGGKVYETLAKAFGGDEIKAGELVFDIIQGITEPMFAQTMLSGIDGAFEAVAREARFNDDEGVSAVALLNYCTENWLAQFAPSMLGAVARTADDTVRTYYTEKGEEDTLLNGVATSIGRKIPGVANTSPTKLDMWGQPVSSGNLAERLLENFISPGYYEKNTEDKATKALHSFATENGIAYTDIIPDEPEKYFTTASGKQINLTADEYELYAGEIGKARKEAVEKYLVNGKPVEVELTVKKIKSSNKSGLGSDKITYRGSISSGKNTYNWAPSGKLEGYVQYNDAGKAVSITPASDETFRKELFDEVMKQATDAAKSKAQAQILKNRNNKKE